MKKFEIIITDTRILTEDYNIQNHMNIGINNGTITYLSADSINGESAETINGSHLLWMPGLTDAHMHTCQQLLRGKILDELPMIWTRIMLPFESTLTEEAVSISAKLASLEMIKGGTTSFIDAGGIHMDGAAEVYITSGLRGALTLSTMDDPKVPEIMRADCDQAISRLNSFYDTWNGSGDGMLQVFYSLRSLISCSEPLIKGVFEAANSRNAMIEAHMNEYPNEINYHLERYQLRPIEYLDSLGLLSDRFVSAHSILLSEHEIELMKQYDIKAVNCPFSNCGKGVPNTPRLLESNISTAFGTDGTAHGGMSLFQEMKIFRSIMNVRYGVPESNPVIMPAETILDMATTGGAAALGLKDSLGKIKEGYKADLIAINLNQAHIYPTNNLVHSLVESVSSQDIIHSIAGGKLLMKDRTVLTLDEEKIKKEVHEFLQNNHMLEDELCYR
jgi:5-methylthioadenosine/S-adenosylhomocysteine deaminase